MNRVASALDFFFNKLLPKKFIVITVATVIVFMKLSPPQEYWFILIAYFGVNAVGKFARSPRGNNDTNIDSVDSDK